MAPQKNHRKPGPAPDVNAACRSSRSREPGMAFRPWSIVERLRDDMFGKGSMAKHHQKPSKTIENHWKTTKKHGKTHEKHIEKPLIHHQKPLETTKKIWKNTWKTKLRLALMFDDLKRNAQKICICLGLAAILQLLQRISMFAKP